MFKRSMSDMRAAARIRAKQAGEMAARRMSGRAFEVYSGGEYTIIANSDGTFTFENEGPGFENMTFDEMEQYFEGIADDFERFEEEEADDGNE